MCTRIAQVPNFLPGHAHTSCMELGGAFTKGDATTSLFPFDTKHPLEAKMQAIFGWFGELVIF